MEEKASVRIGPPSGITMDVRAKNFARWGSKYECPRTNAFSYEKALQKTSVTCKLKDVRVLPWQYVSGTSGTDVQRRFGSGYPMDAY